LLLQTIKDERKNKREKERRVRKKNGVSIYREPALKKSNRNNKRAPSRL
jgi:hypothetical protein